MNLNQLNQYTLTIKPFYEQNKIFSTPHKALRKLMAEFSLLAGRTDYANESELHVLKQTGNEMFDLLKEHAHIEETIILAVLETKAPGSSEENTEEHELLEKSTGGT